MIEGRINHLWEKNRNVVIKIEYGRKLTVCQGRNKHQLLCNINNINRLETSQLNCLMRG